MNQSTSISALAADAAEAYRLHFREEPIAIGVAPGRVNLIGEHVDYEGGLVLPMAINRWLAVALGVNEEAILRGTSPQTASSEGGVDEWRDSDPSGSRSWLKYVAGVSHGYRELGWSAAGVNVAIASSLPLGAGLSSSAAIETAAAIAMEAAGAPALSSVDRALLCQKAEHDFAGVPCGLMDQLTVGCAKLDHALLIDCRSQETTPVPLPTNVEVLVVNTGVRHDLGQSEYPKRRAECREAAKLLGVELLRDATTEGVRRTLVGEARATIRNRAEHVVLEIARVREFSHALEANDLVGLGRLMGESHDSLRDLFEVSCGELDALVSIGRAIPNVIGCRMTGGGFGGSAVFLVVKSAIEAVASEIQSRYRVETGLEAEPLRVTPACAARVFDPNSIQEQLARTAARKIRK